jgi:hypothetical protein
VVGIAVVTVLTVVAISMRSSPRVEYFVIHDTRARNT